MEIAEFTESESVTATEQAVPADFTHCDECGAPVDHLQRYCVECGAHRAGVPDPAAAYLSRSSHRARTQVRTAGGRPGRRRRRVNGLVVALAVAIPAAGGIGVAIGDSSGEGGASTSHSRAAGTNSHGSTSSGVGNATGESYLKKSLDLPSQVKVP